MEEQYEEEYRDEQQPIKTSPYANPMYNYGSSINTLTDPSDELAQLEAMYRGKEITKEGDITDAGSPMMNGEGICSVMGQIRIIVGRNTIMSSLTRKNEIPMLIEFLADTLAKDLMMNRVTYQITSYAARDKIFFSALAKAFICMKRADEESISDKKFWRGSVQEIHSNVNTNARRPGIFSKMMGWNR